MTQAIAKQNGSLAALDDATMAKLLAGGDCSGLSPAQKTAYFVSRCEAAGLDPRAQPFAFVRLNGKEVLYAQKAASDQLAAKHGVRLAITSQATEDGIRIVTVRAEAKDGRVTEEIGALPIGGLKGEALANALMKCVTKAKRRAVLSLCGLGMLDETEVDSIPNAAPGSVLTPVAPPPPSLPKPDPVVVTVVDPAQEREDKAKAAALANVAAAAQILDGQPDLKTRARIVWNRALHVVADPESSKEEARAEVKGWVEGILGGPKPSAEWTLADLEKLEADLNQPEQGDIQF